MWEGDRRAQIAQHDRRRRRQWMVAAILVAAIAIPATVLALGSNGRGHPSAPGRGRAAATTSTSSTTTSTTSTTTTSALTPFALPPDTTTTSPLLSGRITRAGGAPVTHAYVIGLDDLSFTTTDNKGEFVMPCTGQPLLVSPWLAPVTSAGGATVAGYVPGIVPGGPGPGYVFSGGHTELSDAEPAPCDGTPVNVRLPLGATVIIDLYDSNGAPYAPPPGRPPVDYLTLPGFGGRSVRTQAPISDGGVQTLSELGSGPLRIDAAQGRLLCRGGGVSPDTPSATVVITAQAGDTVGTRCRLVA
jgi:hypothetical protein